MKPQTRYALFAWDTGRDRDGLISMADIIGVPEMLRQGPEDGDEWKKPKAERQKKRLAFVAFCSTPQEVISRIREDVNRQYVLMTGTVENVQVATPVFVAGKNLATLNHEWGETEE